MTLHPQAEAFLAMVAEAPPLRELSVAENRAALAQILPATGPATALAEVRDTTLEGPAGPIGVRVYRPDDGVLGVTAYFHGGGWVLGDLESHDTTCRDLAVASGGVVVAVDYRRAPEAPFPAAVEDALAATRALLDGSADLGTDPARVAVAGDSAGGNLAAVVAQELRGRGLVHQALVYPVAVGRTGTTPSYAQFADGHFLTRDDMAWFLEQYAPGVDPADPRLSPAEAQDLAGLAPATVLTAECDPLRDEGERYATRLADAGVEVLRRRYAGQVHPFVLLAGIVEDAVHARALLGRRLRDAFAAG